MLKRYRNDFLAVGGCVVLAIFLALFLQPQNVNLSGNTGYQEQATGYRAGGYDCQPDAIKALSSGERARRAITCQEAEEEHRLKTNDLIQQRRAADAAEATSIFTFQQTRIAAWGMALGLITMAAAIAAAFYARDAAKAARDSLKHASETSRAELRAYLRSDTETVTREEGENGKFTAKVVVINAGATPALETFATVDQQFSYGNGGIDELQSVRWSIGTVSPGAILTVDIPGQLDEDASRAFEGEKGEIVYFLRINFKDQFGERWSYSQDLVVTKDSLVKGDMHTMDCGHTKHADSDSDSDQDEPEPDSKK